MIKMRNWMKPIAIPIAFVGAVVTSIPELASMIKTAIVSRLSGRRK